jgi:hypothetical protein
MEERRRDKIRMIIATNPSVAESTREGPAGEEYDVKSEKAYIDPSQGRR